MEISVATAVFQGKKKNNPKEPSASENYRLRPACSAKRPGWPDMSHRKSVSSRLGDRVIVQKKEKTGHLCTVRSEICPRCIFFRVCVVFRWWFQTMKKCSERKEGKLTVRKFMGLSEGNVRKFQMALKPPIRVKIRFVFVPSVWEKAVRRRDRQSQFLVWVTRFASVGLKFSWQGAHGNVRKWCRLRGIVLDVFSNILSSSSGEKIWGILAKWIFFFLQQSWKWKTTILETKLILFSPWLCEGK